MRAPHGVEAQKVHVLRKDDSTFSPGERQMLLVGGFPHAGLLGRQHVHPAAA
jgi:hypothetical protein